MRDAERGEVVGQARGGGEVERGIELEPVRGDESAGHALGPGSGARPRTTACSPATVSSAPCRPDAPVAANPAAPLSSSTVRSGSGSTTRPGPSPKWSTSTSSRPIRAPRDDDRRVLDVGAHRVQVGIPQRRVRGAQREERAVPAEPPSVRLLVGEGAGEDRARERGRVLGIRCVDADEVGELGGTAGAHGGDEIRIGVAHEVRERRRLAVLLAHEEQRDERGEQDGRGRDLGAAGPGERLESLTPGAVADLVVVLRAHHEAVGGQAGGVAPEAVVAEGGVAVVVHPAARERRGEVVERRVVGVVAGPLAGDGGVERVMEVVAPHAVEPESAGGGVRTRRASLAADSAITTRGRRSRVPWSWTASVSWPTKGVAPASTMACTASSRSPSTWHPEVHQRALSTKNSRTSSLPAPSKLGASPHGVR